MIQEIKKMPKKLPKKFSNTQDFTLKPPTPETLKKSMNIFYRNLEIIFEQFICYNYTLMQYFLYLKNYLINENYLCIFSVFFLRKKSSEKF